jgi:hypothetical protein
MYKAYIAFSEYSRVYVGQTGHTTKAMYKEMECHMSLNQMDKSEIAVNVEMGCSKC